MSGPRAARLTRGPATSRSAGKAAAHERREAYVRGHQLAEMRTAAGVTQAELANALGVSQARISKIEHGEISGIDVVRAYVSALWAEASTWSPGSATGAGRWPDRAAWHLPVRSRAGAGSSPGHRLTSGIAGRCGSGGVWA